MSQTDPNDPPVQDEPYDVPVYPEGDTPPGTETDIRVAAAEPGEHDAPGEGQDDVDDDDLDPQAPHSPPDVGNGRVIFNENEVAR